MFLLWLVIGISFWVAYFQFTRGAVTRHIGFLHYALFFFSIYFGAYMLYVESGEWNTKLIVSVMAYPILGMAGMAFAQLFAWRTVVPDGTMRLDSREARLVAAIALFFISLYSIYLYSLWPDIPLIGLLRGGEELASQVARFMATKGYTGEGVGGLRLFFWLPRVMIDYFSAFVVVFAFLWAWKRGKGYLKFIVIFGSLVFMAALHVEKYPPAKLFAILALLIYNLRNPRLRFRSVLTVAWLGVVGVFAAGLIFSAAAEGFRSLIDRTGLERTAFVARAGWNMLTTRGVVGQASGLNQTFRLVPHDHDFFGGRTLANPRHIFPYTQVPWGFLVYDSYINPTPGVQGSDPTVFYGEVYANWGLTAAFVSMFLFGMLLQVVNNKLARDIDRGGTVFDTAYFYMLLLYLGDWALGFSTPWFDERLWFFVALYILRRRLMAGSAPASTASRTSEVMA